MRKKRISWRKLPKFQVNETNSDSVVQSSIYNTRWGRIDNANAFIEKEKKQLVARVTLLQIKLNHVFESYISQLYSNVWVNQDMKVLLLSYGAIKKKELFRKEFNNLETKFAEDEKAINSLLNKLVKCKESKQL